MKTIKIVFTTLLLAAVLTGCGGDTNSVEAKQAELEKLKTQQAELTAQIKTLEDEIKNSGVKIETNERVRNVAVTALAPQLFEHSIDVQGRVDAEENVTIAAKAAGTVKRVNLQAGDKVNAGQIIAEIDHDIVDAQIATVKTSWKLADDMFTKQKSLWEQKIGSEMQYLQAKSNKESLDNQLKTLQEQLDFYLIKAPVNGTLDDVEVKAGQTIAPGMPCARVVNLSKLKVKAEISESYASRIKNGNDVVLFFPDINKSVNAKVLYSAKVINPLTRTFGVEINLPAGEDFRPNMIAVVRIIDYSKTAAVVVPINTIQSTDNKSHVFIALKEGTKTVAKKRDVQVGNIYNGKAEILSGLQNGEMLITTGYQDLNENELVTF